MKDIQKRYEFDLGKWLSKTIVVPSVYRELLALTSDPKAIAEHANGREVQEATAHGIGVCQDPKMKEILCHVIQESVKDASEVYSRQLLVMAVTYMEAMLKEFFIAAFRKNPNSMYEYVGNTEVGKNGWIQLSTITEAKSLNHLLNDLASTASSNAAKGKIHSIFHRVKKLTKYEIKKDLGKSIQTLVDKRNLVVHEAVELEVDQSEVESAYDLLSDLLQELGRAAKKGVIPYSDPAGLVD